MIRLKKSVLFSTSLLNPIFVFILSIFSCLVVLLIERNLGISWDFHPDATTYINQSHNVIDSIGKLSSVINNAFYYYVNFFNSNIISIISTNILIYSLTNFIIASFYLKNCQIYSKSFHSVLFLLVLFNPYRIHLADHVLKDTIIIALLVFFTISQNRLFKFSHFLLLFLFRIASFIYLVAFIKFKEVFKMNWFNSLFFIVVFFGMIIYSWDRIIFISTVGLGDMSFRDFDKIPNFYDLGFIGSILRAILWPILYLTGAFIFFSPSIMYLPIALGSFLLQLWSIYQLKKLGFVFSIYCAMAIFAFIVSGFNSFIRYSLPLLTILPILVIQRQVIIS